MDSLSKSRDTSAFDDEESRLDWLLEELPSQYELLGLVSKGGMGRVFKAQNRYTGAHVAIKIMRVESAQSKEAIQRFFLEAKAASLLKHPNICRVLDFGVTKSGMPYLVMDWVNGVNLEKKVSEEKALSVQQTLFVFREVAAALAHAHHKKVIHRDLKPENIMISQAPDGHMEIQLVDFGIAKMFDDASAPTQSLTRVGVAVGTPTYMSPEQARGLAVDKRTDIYSLGCTMYFAICGRSPFSGKTQREIMEKHLSAVPPPIDSSAQVPKTLQSIIFKAMQKKPSARFASMEELSAAFDKVDKIPEPDKSHVRLRKFQAPPKHYWLKWIVMFVVGFAIMFAMRLVFEHFSGMSEDSPITKSSHIIHKLVK